MTFLTNFHTNSFVSYATCKKLFAGKVFQKKLFCRNGPGGPRALNIPVGGGGQSDREIEYANKCPELREDRDASSSENSPR